MHTPDTRPLRLFDRLLDFRWPILIVGLAVLGGAISYLPSLTRDTSADAFIDPENPALVYRDKVEEIFGLADPIVIAVINDGESGIFNPGSLRLVEWLTEHVEELDNVDPDRVTSLATASNIEGTAHGMKVEDFFEEPPDTPGRARQIREAIADFPLYRGSLVARDGTATVIVAELIDESVANETYDAIMDLVDDAPTSSGDGIHVAGEGAITGYLSTYIDQDARRLNPLAALIITIVLFLAFWTLRGALVPNLIVLATVGGTFGVMAAVGVSFYVITNGLVVCLIGIAVADSIHIFSQYYEEQRADPEAPPRKLVVRSMATMWRPVTLTTLTTMVGFLMLYPTNTMPPLQYFGLFGGLGVAVAWLYSMTVLPAILSLLPKKTSRVFQREPNAQFNDREGGADRPSRLMRRFGRLVLRHPRMIVAAGVVVVLVGALGATQVKVEEAMIENFQEDEPIYVADKRINEKMDGTYSLDVVVEAPEVDGLYNPKHLRQIEALQEFLETLPGVGGTTSVVDYVKQMHRAVNEDRPAFYRIPDDPQLVAQLFLLYEASGDPTDFEEEIDYDRRTALVRASVNTGLYSNNKRVVEATRAYLDEHFADSDLQASVAGRVNVDYAWIQGIAQSHVWSVLLSFLAVLAMAALLFRSLRTGLLAVLPVGMAILLIYAVMGFFDIWLGVGTSMFAAIAIGLGVDFAIHTIDRMRELLDRPMTQSSTLHGRLLELFPSTGRALLFNVAAIALGFGVLTTSDVPPLVNFGTLVALAVSTAFLASMTVPPALVTLFGPSVLGVEPAEQEPSQSDRRSAPVTATVVLALGLAGASVLSTGVSYAQELPSGRKIMQQVNARDEGEHVVRTMRLELTDRRGRTRVQTVRSLRRYFGEEKRTVLFYTSPANVKGTAFLTYDYPDPDRDDDQWLYLPALRKVRRISAADRGDYFLGTDLTYEEVKKEGKVELADYRFTTKGTEEVDGHRTYVVEGRPVSENIVDELGYSRVRWRIDPEIWMIRKADYWDTNGNPLKTLENLKIEQIDGIRTTTKLRVENHKTGHKTVITWSNIDYEAPVDEDMFERRALRRGL